MVPCCGRLQRKEENALYRRRAGQRRRCDRETGRQRLSRHDRRQRAAAGPGVQRPDRRNPHLERCAVEDFHPGQQVPEAFRQGTQTSGLLAFRSGLRPHRGGHLRPPARHHAGAGLASLRSAEPRRAGIQRRQCLCGTACAEDRFFQGPDHRSLGLLRQPEKMVAGDRSGQRYQQGQYPSGQRGHHRQPVLIRPARHRRETYHRPGRTGDRKMDAPGGHRG